MGGFICTMSLDDLKLQVADTQTVLAAAEAASAAGSSGAAAAASSSSSSSRVRIFSMGASSIQQKLAVADRSATMQYFTPPVPVMRRH